MIYTCMYIYNTAKPQRMGSEDARSMLTTIPSASPKTFNTREGRRAVGRHTAGCRATCLGVHGGHVAARLNWTQGLRVSGCLQCLAWGQFE